MWARAPNKCSFFAQDPIVQQYFAMQVLLKYKQLYLAVQNFIFHKFKMVDGRQFWNRQIQYLYNRLTDFDEIWYRYWFSQTEHLRKFWNFKNPKRQTAAILQIEHLRYLQYRLANFVEILHGDAYSYF